MTRRWLLTLALLSTSLVACAQNFYTFPAPIPGGVFYVCGVPAASNPCSNQVSIYPTSALGTPLQQPVVIGLDGQYGFWLPSSQGQITIELQLPFPRVYVVSLGGSGINTGTTGHLAYYSAPSALSSNPNIDDGITNLNALTVAGGDTAGIFTPSITGTGSNGGWSAHEGTGANCATGGGIDCIFPDATLHCMHGNFNGVDKGCITGVTGLLRILPESVSYTTVAADFTTSTTSATMVLYTAISTPLTHTLPSTITPTGSYQIVKNDCGSLAGIYVAQAGGLSIDGDSAVNLFLPPCTRVTIYSNGTNWITDIGQDRLTGGMFFPAIPPGSAAISTGFPFTAVANTPFVTKFVVTIPIKIQKFTTVIQTGAATCVLDMALADANRNILTHYSSGMACTASGNNDVSVTTPLTLLRGVYYLAGCTNVTATLALSGYPLGTAISSFQQVAETGSVGTASNLCTAGVFTAATLGTITNSSTPTNIPTVWAH